MKHYRVVSVARALQEGMSAFALDRVAAWNFAQIKRANNADAKARFQRQGNELTKVAMQIRAMPRDFRQSHANDNVMSVSIAA